MRRPLAASIAAWMAIVFVCPLVLLAMCALVPHALELSDRSRRSQELQPMVLMLLTEVALVILSTATFLSWRFVRGGPNSRRHTWATIALAGATVALGLFAYLWIAVQVASFPS